MRYIIFTLILVTQAVSRKLFRKRATLHCTFVGVVWGFPNNQQGYSDGGSRVPVTPTLFCKPFLRKQPTSGDENDITVWWVPSLWNSVNPPPHTPVWKIFATPQFRYPRQDNASNFEEVSLNSHLSKPGKYLWLISNDLSKKNDTQSVLGVWAHL